MKWAYGITTVPSREFTYLPKTIESLKNAGFDCPTLFVDGNEGTMEKSFPHLPVVRRHSTIEAFGNWFLSLAELWVRYPHYDRYAIFQDDFVTCKNLKDYLDRCELPDNIYWNMLTFPQNEELSGGRVGWYPSNQRGRGAVALAFSRKLVFRILTSHVILAKPSAERAPTANIDGTLVTAMQQINVAECVHSPSLVWHTGDDSAIGNPQHAKCGSFQGEDFDMSTFDACPLHI